MNNKDLTAQR